MVGTIANLRFNSYFIPFRHMMHRLVFHMLTCEGDGSFFDLHCNIKPYEALLFGRP